MFSVSEKGVKNEAAAQPANVPRILTGGSNKRAGFMLFIMLLMFWLFPRLNPTHAIRAQSAIVHTLFHAIPEGSPYMLPMVIPTMKKDNIILSTGGGVFENSENRQLLLEKSVVIYLKASPDVIFDRIKHETHRPLLGSAFTPEKISVIIEKKRQSGNSGEYR